MYPTNHASKTKNTFSYSLLTLCMLSVLQPAAAQEKKTEKAADKLFEKIEVTAWTSRNRCARRHDLNRRTPRYHTQVR